jgi:hypothetical protein
MLMIFAMTGATIGTVTAATPRLKNLVREKGRIPLKAYFRELDNAQDIYAEKKIYECNTLFQGGSRKKHDISIVFSEESESRKIKEWSKYADKSYIYYTSAHLQLAVTVRIAGNHGETITDTTFDFSAEDSSSGSSYLEAYGSALGAAREAMYADISLSIGRWLYASKELQLLTGKQKTASTSTGTSDVKAAQSLPPPSRPVESGGNTLVWDAHSARGVVPPQNFANLPFSAFDLINRRVQAKTDSFMEARAPIDISSRIPPEIPKPELMPMPDLVKDTFETRDEFELRQQRVIADRQDKVAFLQRAYRRDVEERNKRVDALRRARDMDIEEIRREQARKKERLTAEILQFTRQSFYEVMGAPDLEAAGFDAETRTMYAWLKAANANFREKISFKVDATGEAAKTIHKSLNYGAMPSVLFSITPENGLRIEDIRIYLDGVTYLAKLDKTEYKHEPVKIVIKDQPISVDSLAQARLTLQNPNLRDTYVVKAISYSEASGAGGVSYKDDLTPLVNKLKQAPVDPKKWLFMIAIENYDQTDPVAFAKNSAEAFKTAAQRIFGIGEEHTVALIEEKATSGAIKDRLALLLDRSIDEGDIVYFYYSGHGIPDISAGNEPYILPKDKVPDFVVREKEFMLGNIYRQLANSKASGIIAFVDACFSGKTDDKTLFTGVAAPAVVSKRVEINARKMVVVTAGDKNQFSNMYPGKGHRLFTYYLISSLASLRNSSTESIFRELYDNVRRQSIAMGPVKMQEPTILGNTSMSLH